MILRQAARWKVLYADQLFGTVSSVFGGAGFPVVLSQSSDAPGYVVRWADFLLGGQPVGRISVQLDRLGLTVAVTFGKEHWLKRSRLLKGRPKVRRFAAFAVRHVVIALPDVLGHLVPEVMDS